MSDLTPQDQELLSLARGGDLPSADDRARVKRKLFARVGVGVAAGASALSASGAASAGVASASGAGTLALAAKIVIALVVVGAAGSAGWVLSHRTRHAASGAQRAGPVAPQAVAAVRPKALVTAAPSAVPIPPDTTAVAALPPVAKARPGPRASAALAPELTADEPAPSAVASFAPIAPPSAAASSKPAPAPVGPATVAAEAALLRRADAARKAGNAALALALLNQHRAQFPNGVLAEEREAERVAVLCALGRQAQAHAAAASFLRAYPHSPLAVRVRASCAGP